MRFNIEEPKNKIFQRRLKFSKSSHEKIASDTDNERHKLFNNIFCKIFINRALNVIHYGSYYMHLIQ